jgi:hypothetical protein
LFPRCPLAPVTSVGFMAPLCSIRHSHVNGLRRCSASDRAMRWRVHHSVTASRSSSNEYDCASTLNRERRIVLAGCGGGEPQEHAIRLRPEHHLPFPGSARGSSSGVPSRWLRRTPRRATTSPSAASPRTRRRPRRTAVSACPSWTRAATCEGRLDHIRRPHVLSVLSGEVEEREQHVGEAPATASSFKSLPASDISPRIWNRPTIG